MANYKDRIASINEEMKQLENRKKEYEQKFKAQERKARTNRICKRGGFLESVLPDTKSFTDEQFEMFIKRTLLTEYATREISKIKAQNPPQESPEAAGTTEQSADATADKPAETAKANVISGNTNAEKPRNGAA